MIVWFCNDAALKSSSLFFLQIYAYLLVGARSERVNYLGYDHKYTVVIVELKPVRRSW